MDKRKCTQCGMQLWVTVIPRPMRLPDTRHTCGTLLAQRGFDGVRLQRAMRHGDFKMTARYVHTNVEDLRAVGDCLPPAALEPVPPPPAALDPASGAGAWCSLLQAGGKGKKKGPGPLKNSQGRPAPVLARPRGFERK